MNDEFQSRVEHFAALKSKYQATKYEDSLPSSLLYLILRKVDLGIQLTDLEFNWLLESENFETFEVIQQSEQRRAEELRKLEAEFSQLQSKYRASCCHTSLSSLASTLYPILWRLDSENQLTNSEIDWLMKNRLVETGEIALKIGHFATLKAQYQATKHQNSSPDSPLYHILKQLDIAERLSDSDVNWLIDNELFETIEIYQQQEAARSAEFSQLKSKYQATQHQDSSVSSPLYPILQKIDADNLLNASELDWLKQQELTETIAIIQLREKTRHFAALKAKYKATQHEDSSPSSHLYKVIIKLESSNQLGEQDISFLNKRGLTETIEIAKQKYSYTLKSKIELVNHLSESEIEWLQKNGM